MSPVPSLSLESVAVLFQNPVLGSCRNADTLKRLQDTEKKLKEKREAEYINLDLSNEEREKGNQVRADLH